MSTRLCLLFALTARIQLQLEGTRRWRHTQIILEQLYKNFLDDELIVTAHAQASGHLYFVVDNVDFVNLSRFVHVVCYGYPARLLQHDRMQCNASVEETKEQL